MTDTAAASTVRSEIVRPKVARITLARPDTRNAQDEAHRVGMVNRVVARDELEDVTLALAEQIARKPLFALKLTEKAVNAAQDAQGRVPAIQTSFALHQLCHSHNQQVHGTLIDPSITLP